MEQQVRSVLGPAARGLLSLAVRAGVSGRGGDLSGPLGVPPTTQPRQESLDAWGPRPGTSGFRAAPPQARPEEREAARREAGGGVGRQKAPGSPAPRGRSRPQPAGRALEPRSCGESQRRAPVCPRASAGGCVPPPSFVHLGVPTGPPPERWKRRTLWPSVASHLSINWTLAAAGPGPSLWFLRLPGQGGRDGRGWDGGGQQLTPAFREGCPSGGSQPRLAHLLTPRCPLPASPGRCFCDRGISIFVKSPQTMPPLCGEMKSPAPGGGARLKSPKGGAAGIRGGGCVEMKAGEKCRAACARLRSDPSPGIQDCRGGSQPPGNPSALYSPRPRPLPRNYRPPAGSRAGLRPMRRPQSLEPQDGRAQCPPRSPFAPAWVLPPRCAGPGLPGTAWQALRYPLGGHETPSPTFRALPKRNQDPCLRPWTPRPWLRSLGRRGVPETWVSRRSQPAPEVRRRRVCAGSPGAPGRRRSPQPTQPWSPDPTRARLEGHAAVAPRVSPLWGGEGGAGVRPIGGGSRPHVSGAGPGSRQNVNEKEERDLKVLAAPAEDKCAGFARAPPAARRRRPTAGQTDGRADG
ncbi:unnamed protein product [Rangifer tarandus platyrhynchus]|uniref:Uncharacterized protein n=1 Tax=Rangifer tarandus platyrhynchus TaxID=3082113 RepID=A0ABN8XU51_RANTA|nr:unnamed protein product [Rangifer tarandus platyrhynchus]